MESSSHFPTRSLAQTHLPRDGATRTGQQITHFTSQLSTRRLNR